MMAFSAAYEDGANSHATNRTTELFINLADHLQLDALGFTPIARVVAGLNSTVRGFYSGYGEMRDACALHGFLPCDGPSEAEVLRRGNAYLDESFPLLTRVHTVRIEEEAHGPRQDVALAAALALTVVAAAAIGVVAGVEWLRAAWRRKKGETLK